MSQIYKFYLSGNVNVKKFYKALPLYLTVDVERVNSDFIMGYDLEGRFTCYYKNNILSFTLAETLSKEEFIVINNQILALLHSLDYDVMGDKSFYSDIFNDECKSEAVTC